VLDDIAPIELELAADGTLECGFTVRESGLYHIELDTGSGSMINGSPEYLVEVMVDVSPSVVFAKPGRDVRVTLVDEVYLEAEAVDDFGVRSLELVYSVNGGEEQVVSL